MDYTLLRKMKHDLSIKDIKSKDEEKLLAELESLTRILDTRTFSLATASANCPTCGKPITK